MRELTKEERRILEDHIKWLKGEGGERAGLRGADLSEADLRGVDLRNSDLREINLRGANLYGTNLSEADLRGANLMMSNMRGTVLSSAKLQNANLYGSDLSGADLRWATLQGADLRIKDLNEVNLQGSEGILSIGPVGSRGEMAYAFVYEKNIFIRYGYFSGTLKSFSEKVITLYKESFFGKEYKAVIDFIKVWASIHFGIKS